MTELTIRLPWPPTVNTYWRSIMRGPLAGRVLLSERGRNYRKNVADEVTAQQVRIGALAGRLAVHVSAFPPDRRARDLDNLSKGVLDSLKHAGVIRDDGDIDDLHLVRGRVVAGGYLLVRLSEIPGAATESAPLFEPLPMSKARARTRRVAVNAGEKPF
jgi:crossover junction endodeoxyribonuclease RusA